MRSLEQELQEITRINEKVKSDLFQSQKNYHAENSNNQDIVSQSINLQNALKCYNFHFILLIKNKK